MATGSWDFEHFRLDPTFLSSDFETRAARGRSSSKPNLPKSVKKFASKKQNYVCVYEPEEK